MSDWVFRGSNWTSESRTRRVYQGQEVIATFQQARKVELTNYDEIGYSETSAGVPSCVSGLVAPTESNTTGINVVYDERVRWNNITGKWVKTRVARTGIANTSAQNPGGWETISGSQGG